MNGKCTSGGGASAGMDCDLKEELSARLDHFVKTAGWQARGYYLAGKSAARWNTALGLTVIVATALTTTGVVSSIASEDSNGLAMTSAVLAFIATVVSGAQKVGNYAEQASKFQAAGTRFDRICADGRKAQFAVAQLPPGKAGDGPDWLHNLECSRADASAEAPDLKDRFYDRAKGEKR